MGLDIQIKNVSKRLELDSLRNFVLKQNLGYPHYRAWVEKAYSELEGGSKQAIFSSFNGVIVGNIIYQEHRSVPGILELKNIRIHPRLRGRNFASFMLRQIEAETLNSYNAMVIDTRTSQKDMIDFLISQNFLPINTLPLYESKELDVMFMKFNPSKVTSSNETALVYTFNNSLNLN